MTSTASARRPCPDDLFAALDQLSPSELVALIAEAGAALGRRGGQAWAAGWTSGSAHPASHALGAEPSTLRGDVAGPAGRRCSTSSRQGRPALGRSGSRPALPRSGSRPALPRSGSGPAHPRPGHGSAGRSADRLHRLTLHGIREAVPGARWRQLFDVTWPGYRAWFASEGLERRAGLRASRQALRRHMPELVPTWERLVDLASGDRTGLLQGRLTSLTRDGVPREGCRYAEEVSRGVQARCGAGRPSR